VRTEPQGLGFSWERVEGGPMEAATMGLGAVGACNCSIVRGRPGDAKK
jgi:hypothetical protein